MNVAWTDERVELLARLWAEGLSGGQIATQLGVTRNAVIGKVHRLGLASRGRAAPLPPKPAPRPRLEVRAFGAPTPAPREPQIAPVTPAPEPGAAVTVLTIRHGQCRWPLGDPRDDAFRFCGATVAGEGCSYCAEHRARAYAPLAPGKPRTAAALARSLRRYVA